MSDATSGTPNPQPEAAAPVAAAPLSAEAIAKKDRAEKLIADILRLMELPARMEVKDGADGSVSVALFFEQEVPAAPNGRRSHLVDALQFLLNKIINRPNTERRWINIGVGAHPEPRQPRPERPERPVRAPQAPAAAAPAQAREQPKPPRANGAAPQRSAPPPPAKPAAAAQPDEAALEVAEDADVTRIARALAEKSAQLGRFYAVSPMKQEDRARFLRAARGVEGVTLKVEGEARARRVVFVPAKPAPMPSKSSLPADDGDED